MASVLNLDALNAASVKAEPYPYFAVERSISAEAVTDIIRDFPKINDGGSYNLDDVTIGPGVLDGQPEALSPKVTRVAIVYPRTLRALLWRRFLEHRGAKNSMWM